ncbi:MAG: RagB/SusD family nutrient uptake outer membrane protein [Prolixibacteraceae bacterium]|jgi:hypothetical protein|nr:RagB/SusD family nutrient uptake outer membrane protein [Prolixibacteraceae bacterium]
MKNKITTLITVLILSVFYQGCTNLEEEVYDKLPVDEFGKTTKEINSLIAPIYRTFKDIFPTNFVYLSECSGDMAIVPTRKGGDWWDGGLFKELRLHKWTPNTAAIRGPYNAAVKNISVCNKIYSIVEENPAIDNKEITLAEIRGVRAFWYYLLCDYYGNVPIVTNFKDTSNPVTKTRKEVYNFIINELNAIKDIVRSDVTGASYGKITKGFVYTLLAKMYLNSLVWNPDGGAKWTECMNACNEVMKLPYVIEPNYKASFVAQNQNSKEIIFPCVFSVDDGGNRMHRYTLHYLDRLVFNLNITPYNGICAMPDYVKSFDPDDRRYAWSFITGPMINPASGKVIITAHGRELIHYVDVTKKYNIDADGWGQVEQEDGARCGKWEFENGLSAWMENDFAIFRLADVYLMKAECLVRLGQDNAEATRLVNELRKRAFIHTGKLKSSVNLDDIYNERRFELAWEISCRQDMIRFGKFLNPIPGWKTSSASIYLLFPIPQTALDANPGLSQNPGY